MRTKQLFMATTARALGCANAQGTGYTARLCVVTIAYLDRSVKIFIDKLTNPNVIMGVATDQLSASLNEIQQLQGKKTIVFLRKFKY